MSDSSEKLERLKTTLLQTEILAQFGGSLVSPEATEFVANLMKNWYTITNDGTFETTNETLLSTMDLRPMPVDQIGDYLRVKHGYLFRQFGTPGVSNAQTVAPPPPPLNRAEMSVAERSAFIRKYGQKEYLSLPENAAAARPLAERRRSEMSNEERARLIRERGAAFYMGLPA